MGCSQSNAVDTIKHDGDKEKNGNHHDPESLNGPKGQSKLDVTADNIQLEKDHSKSKLNLKPIRQESPLKEFLPKGQAMFDWKSLPFNQIQIITAQFQYCFDVEHRAFRIMNEA